jgi:hypothetical protein
VAKAPAKTQDQEQLHVPSDSGITDQNAARTYRLEERLAGRGEQTRELVGDAAEIPRTWEPEWTPPSAPQEETWILIGALWASAAVQTFVVYAITILNPAGDLFPNLIPVSLGAGAAIALMVCASRNLSRRPAFANISLAIGCIEFLIAMAIGDLVCTR